MNKSIIVTFLAMITYISTSQAMVIELIKNQEGVYEINMSGPVVMEDFNDFKELVDTIEYATNISTGSYVVFGDSDGGFTKPAKEIGRYIRSHDLNTRVKKGASCASACAFMWLAGNIRTIPVPTKEDDGALFHSSYLPNEDYLKVFEKGYDCDLDEGIDEEDAHPFDDYNEDCEFYSEEDKIDTVRYMRTSYLKQTYEYMLEMGAPNEWIMKSIFKVPTEFYTVNDVK